MRVVSQNRDLSFEFERTVLSVNDTCVRARIGNRDATIGMYDSADRAKVVFNDIHNAYAPVQFVTDNMTEDEVKAFVGSINTPIKTVGFARPDQTISVFDSVYYMPEV